MNTAFLFPGQGAQYVGMGFNFAECFPEAKNVFKQAENALDSAFVDIIFNGPEEKLKLTRYTQPAILTASHAIYTVLQKSGISPDAVAGLSLGEYTALVAAGSISFEDALPLVQKRGIFMQDAVVPGEGTMVAIMGLSQYKVEEICSTAAEIGTVSPANYNCPGQIVISGNMEAVHRAIDLAGKAGAKKITELKVSAPFHCSLLKPVEEKLEDELRKIKINKPVMPIIFNVSAAYADQPDMIKDNLVRQVSNPILWEQSIKKLIDSGIKRFISLGPGNSLARLMKRIAPQLKTISIEKPEDLEKVNN